MADKHWKYIAYGLIILILYLLGHLPHKLKLPSYANLTASNFLPLSGYRVRQVVTFYPTKCRQVHLLYNH